MTSRGRTRGRGSFRSRGPRRAVEWFDTNVNSGVVPGSQFQDDLTRNVVNDEKKGMTLVRTLIHIEMLAITAGFGSIVALGIVAITRDAFGAVSIPNPSDELDKPGWLWRINATGVYTAVVSDRSSTTVVDLDLKMQRKLRGEEDLLVLVGEVAAGGVSTINFDGYIRMLFKKS